MTRTLQTILAHVIGIALGCAGLWGLWRWYTSPIDEKMDIETLAAVVRGIEYWAGWGLIFGVCLVLVLVPLYGMWAEMRRR